MIPSDNAGIFLLFGLPAHFHVSFCLQAFFEAQVFQDW